MKRTFAILLLAVVFFSVLAQEANQVSYRRSSLYSVLVSHPEKKMNTEIVTAYMSLQTPDKFNNHDITPKMFTTTSKRDDAILDEANEFLTTNQAPKGLVSKWFNRDSTTGWFDADLIIERGQYNASDVDVQTAKQSKRGMALLDDAGFELIGNTFVIVNDITYIDKEANAQKAKNVLSILASVAGAVANSSSDASSRNTANSVKSVLQLGSVISDVIAGFTVKITTYLYRLEWNDDIANTFYDNYYIERPTDSLSFVAFCADSTVAPRKLAYESDSSLFTINYVGSFNARSSKTVLRGLNEPADVFRKVCARAIDNNIVELQKKYDDFKVKVPLYTTEPITAKIGMKEGVDPKCKYEVILPITDEETGRTKYRRVGLVQPVKNKIWDNRYMAVEEEADNANLTATTFKKISGGNFYPGMLIREVKSSTGNTSE